MYDAENSFFMLNRSIFVCASQGKYNGNTFFKSKKFMFTFLLRQTWNLF